MSASSSLVAFRPNKRRVRRALCSRAVVWTRNAWECWCADWGQEDKGLWPRRTRTRFTRWRRYFRGTSLARPSAPRPRPHTTHTKIHNTCTGASHTRQDCPHPSPARQSLLRKDGGRRTTRDAFSFSQCVPLTPCPLSLWPILLYCVLLRRDEGDRGHGCEVRKTQKQSVCVHVCMLAERRGNE